MSFWGSTFVFDSVPSETYNLYIAGMGDSYDNASNDIEIKTESIWRRPVVYTYGTQQSPVLQFGISFRTPVELTAPNSQLVQSWLFGKNEYKKLQIMQNDMQDMHFNCFLTSPQIVRVGNLIIGFDATAVCDAPWGWTFPKTYTYNYSGSVIATLNHQNQSDYTGYTYPQMTFTMNLYGGDLSIANASDNDREFSITDLDPNEIITIDNDLQILSSSGTTRRLSNFNKNWLRFVRGLNVLTVTGDIAQITFTYKQARKLGG